MKLRPTEPTPNLSGLIDRSPGDLKPWATNPRRHNEAQFTKLMANIRLYGFTSPVIVDETSTVLSGHARVEAANRLWLRPANTGLWPRATFRQLTRPVTCRSSLLWAADRLRQGHDLCCPSGVSTPDKTRRRGANADERR
jgi:hypothetical protein